LKIITRTPKSSQLGSISCRILQFCLDIPFLTEDVMKHDDLTYTIIGFAYKVHNVLGFGFLESVYENALRIELESAGVAVMQQEKLKVWHGGSRCLIPVM